MGLAIFLFLKLPVHWDWPLSFSQSGQSHGTGHFYISEVASPVGLATLDSGKVASPMGLATCILLKWPVPWDWPLFQGTGPYFQAKIGQSRGQSHV